MPEPTIDTEESIDNPQGTETDESTDTEAVDSIELPDGTMASAAQLMEWKSNGMKQADYSRKTAALKDEKAHLRETIEKEIREQLEREIVSRPASQSSPEEPSPLDEYVPGLGKVLSNLDSKIDKLTQAQQKTHDEAQRFLKDSEMEERWDAVLDEVGKKPFADKDLIRQTLEERNLGPEHAELVYHALAGFKLGELAKEAALKKRRADAPSPMKPGSIGLPQSRAQDVPGAMKPVEQQSWQEVSARARNDPRRPRVE